MFKGVSKSVNSINRVWLCIIDEFSDELKALIRTRLTSICHGSSIAQQGKEAYSYERTLKDFLSNYEKKTQKTQMGMIGELLAHLLVSHCDKDMKTASPFFNMEEKNIKKGFDLVMLNTKSSDLWFTEVKSGNVKDETSKGKNKQLLAIAKKDIKSKLDSNNSWLWHNAINGAKKVFEKNIKFKDKIVEILEESLSSSQDMEESGLSKNVILISILYNSLTDKLDSQDIELFRGEILKEMIFREVVLFSIQKETYKKIEDFLKAESKNV